MPVAVDEVDRHARSASQMPNRSHAWVGRPAMMNMQAAVLSERHRPHERDPERPRPVRLVDPQDEHADADERKGEQRADVRQIVGLGRIADERCQRDDDAGDQRGRVRNAARRDGASRPIAATGRRAPSRKRSAAARTGTRAARPTSRRPRRARRSSPTVWKPATSNAWASGSATASCVYGTMPVSTKPTIT